MEKLYIGEKDCRRKIDLVLINCQAQSMLSQKLYTLMVQLNTPGLTKEKIRKDLQMNHEEFLPVAITKILDEWICRESREKATLENLLIALKNCGLSSIADDVEQAFFPKNNLPLLNCHIDEVNLAAENSGSEINLVGNEFKKYCSLRKKVMSTVACCMFMLLAGLICWLVLFTATATHSKDECSLDVTDGVINKWSAAILHPVNYTNIYKQIETCANSEQYISLFEKATVLAFSGELKYASTVLDFLRGVPISWFKYRGYAALHHAIIQQGYERTGEMLKLIYFVRLAMSDKASVDANLLPKYEDLKSKFPDDMRAITFSENVTIKDSEYNEYIYVSSKWADDKRLVLGWIPGGVVSQAIFTFHPDDVDGSVHFVIRNSFYDKDAPLCMTNSWFNSERRKIGTCPGETNDYIRWFVTPTGNFFTFKNWDIHFIYAPNEYHLYDDERRYVFSWRGDPVDMSYCTNWQYIITPN